MDTGSDKRSHAVNCGFILTLLSVILLPSSGTRVYYEFYDYGPNGTAMEAFPYDFMMGEC